MRNSLLLAVVVALLAPAAAHAQYWVEFNPGTCTVGPPPACVVGHWHPLQLPQSPVRSLGIHATPLADGEEGEQQTRVTDISTDLEYERFSFMGAPGGSSLGLRAMYVRQNASGLGGGAIVTADRSTLENSPASASHNLAGHAYVSADLGGHVLSEEARLDQALTGLVGLSISSFLPGHDGASALNTVGPFATLQYSRFMGLMSYGANLTYSVATMAGNDFGLESTTAGSWALGATAGYMLNEATFFSGDVYGLKGGLMVVGGTMTRSFSPTFGLTLGAKTLLGQDDFSNFRFTLGSTYRAR